MKDDNIIIKYKIMKSSAIVTKKIKTTKDYICIYKNRTFLFSILNIIKSYNRDPPRKILII